VVGLDSVLLGVNCVSAVLKKVNLLLKSDLGIVPKGIPIFFVSKFRGWPI